ncbi:MAG: exosortase K [Lachnospiraceae bacterium]|nr:exosortase K [Lachnospiraceae bacterium]
MKKNMIIYSLAILAVLAVKIFYRTADSEALSWILTPTTWWVGILSGISFEKIAQIGYVSHEYRFIIAPSCSGVRFLLITFVMMIFSFIHQMDSWRKKIYWFGFSVLFSYVSTIFVNGIRIAVSIDLPMMLRNDVLPEWVTAERLHTMIGTVIYFSMLFGIFYLVQSICKRFTMHTDVKEKNTAKRFLTPVFWYFVMVLGIPFLGRLYRNDWNGFWQYALLVMGACALVVLTLGLLGGAAQMIGETGAALANAKKIQTKYLGMKHKF